MSSIRPLIPLLIAAGILLGGNGLQGTLIALRGAQEGFSPATIGFMGTAYFGGFLLGCVFITRIMKAVGHVRSFAALAAIASAGTLLLVLIIDPVMWSGDPLRHRLLLRRPLHDHGKLAELRRAEPRPRARAGALPHHRHRLGHRRAVPDPGLRRRRLHDLRHHVDHDHAVAGAGFARRPLQSDAARGRQARSRPRLAHLAAGGCIGCIAVGVTNSAFRTLSPVYAEQIGMSVTDVVTFVSVGIIGGAIIQYPLGHLSDLWDRRKVLLITTVGAMLAALALVFLAGTSTLANFALVFIFGSFAMPLFSLSAAHANDRADKGEFVLVNAALMLFYSFGAIGGPLAASFFMQRFGPQSLFIFMRRRLRHLHPDHPLPDAGARQRAGQPARAFHRAAAHIDDFRPTDAQKRRRPARRQATTDPPVPLDERFVG